MLSFIFIIGALIWCWRKVTKQDLTTEQLESRVKDRVVIVTGAARGLGKQVARSFSTCGAKVVIVDCRASILHETAVDISAITGPESVLALAGDLADKSFCRMVIEDTISKFGKIDILYINHGIMPACSVAENSIEMIEKVMAVNFMSFVYLAKLALPHIRASKGMYGVTSSMAGKTAMMNLAHYCSSKHALCGFFDSLRIEEQSHGVSVTVVCPGAMKTDLLREGFGEEPKENVAFKLQRPEVLAPAIVHAVVTRQREHYTENALRLASLIRALFPGTIDNVLGPLTVKKF